MPNIKSAKRRMRSDATKQARNRSVKSTLKTAERRLNAVSYTHLTLPTKA